MAGSAAINETWHDSPFCRHPSTDNLQKDSEKLGSLNIPVVGELDESSSDRVLIWLERQGERDNDTIIPTLPQETMLIRLLTKSNLRIIRSCANVR